MTSPTIRLPASVPAWRDLLIKALAVKPRDLRVPPQFAITHGETGDFLETFGQPAPTAKKPRFSGVLSLLMPLDPAVAGACRTSDELAVLRERAGRASSSGNFVPAGQVPWPDGTFDGAFDQPLPFEGLDLVMPVTMRTGGMRAHSRQISFPGGRCDDGETPEQASLRESVEEIGLDVSKVQVIGELTRLFSFPSSAYVHPVIGLSDAFLGCHIASPNEVESIEYLSLGSLLADARSHHRLDKNWSQTGPVRMPAFRTTDGNVVWGLTAFAIGELIARLCTVLDVMPRLPAPVLSAWGDAKLSKVSHIRFMNPYEDALQSDSNSHTIDDLKPQWEAAGTPSSSSSKL